MKNKKSTIPVGAGLLLLILFGSMILFNSRRSKPSANQQMQGYTNARPAPIAPKPVPRSGTTEVTRNSQGNVVIHYVKPNLEGSDAALFVEIEWNSIYSFVSFVQFTYPLENNGRVRLYRNLKGGPIYVEQMNTHGESNREVRGSEVERMFNNAEIIAAIALGGQQPGEALWLPLIATRESSTYWTDKQILLDRSWPKPSQTTPAPKAPPIAHLNRPHSTRERSIFYYIFSFGS